MKTTYSPCELVSLSTVVEIPVYLVNKVRCLIRRQGGNSFLQWEGKRPRSSSANKHFRPSSVKEWVNPRYDGKLHGPWAKMGTTRAAKQYGYVVENQTTYIDPQKYRDAMSVFGPNHIDSDIPVYATDYEGNKYPVPNKTLFAPNNELRIICGTRRADIETFGTGAHVRRHRIPIFWNPDRDIWAVERPRKGRWEELILGPINPIELTQQQFNYAVQVLINKPKWAQFFPGEDRRNNPFWTRIIPRALGLLPREPEVVSRPVRHIKWTTPSNRWKPPRVEQYAKAYHEPIVHGDSTVTLSQVGGIAQTLPNREHTKYWYFLRKRGTWAVSPHHPLGGEDPRVPKYDFS
jgi:hypothetical protein